MQPIFDANEPDEDQPDQCWLAPIFAVDVSQPPSAPLAPVQANTDMD